MASFWSQTRKNPTTKKNKPTSQSSGKLSQASAAPSAATKTQDESTRDLINDARKDKLLKSLWKSWLFMFRNVGISIPPWFRTRYFKLTIGLVITLLAIMYVMKPNLSDIGYPRSLLVLKPELSHESYERTLDVKHIKEKFDHLSARYRHTEVHVVISGGPGSGKSELARQFGQHVYTNNNGAWPYCFNTYFRKLFNISVLPPVDVIRLNAESMTDFQHSIEYIIGTFEGKHASEIAYSKDIGEKEVVATFLQLKQALKKRSRRPVLIIDNVKRAMYRFLYKNRSYGKCLLHPGNDDYGEIRVVVTTQHRPIYELSKTHYMNLFDGMPPNDSVKLLNTITKIHNDDKNASYLAKELGGLPFSLANAAIYIKTERTLHGNESYFHYLQKFKLDLEAYRSDIDFLWNEAKYEGLPYNLSMLTTSIKTINQLVNRSNRDLYKDLACFVGYCDSQTISMQLFLQYTRMNSALHDYTEYSVKELIYRSSIYELQTRSGHTFILSHQVTREASRIVCTPKGLNDNTTQGNRFIENSFQRILKVISKVLDDKPEASLNQMTEYTTLNFKLVDVLMSLVSHSVRLNLAYSQIITKEFCWKFLNSMAEPYLYWPNKHKSTVVMPEVTFLVNMTKESFSEGKPELGAFFSVLYIYYTGNQRPRDLEKIVELVEDFATSSFKNVQQTSVVNTTLLLNMMGTVYRGVGQIMSKAQKLHELALNISQKYISSPMIAVSLHLLGVVHRYRKQLDIAQQYHEQAVELARQIYSDKHPRLGAFLLNLALVYNRQGELKKAKMMYQEALDITKEAYGVHDQRVARVLNTLATNYYSLGQYNDSIHALLEALSIHEEIHGDIHPNVGETLYILGFTYRAKGDLQQSLKTLERSLKIREQYYGPAHYQVGEVLHDLSNTQREMHHLKDALSNGERCLEIFQRSLGEKSSEVGNTLNGIGLIYSELGDLQMAKLKHEKALEIFKELSKQGSQVVGISETLKHLGNVFRKLKDTKKAQGYIRQAFSVLRTVYEENHPRIKELNKLLDAAT
ncbi:uncharacterized protein LOC117110252 [Anneissia japonica]|uniref:uncharacterized protein LOC117110252 n=1 Tax=Anneissia japonica TaxID=1529436 RepID=UPI00142572B9|nr:uncharacterized protein LOC117110252 [Anneissia japonica]